jgi:hypothetical protein
MRHSFPFYAVISFRKTICAIHRAQFSTSFFNQPFVVSRQMTVDSIISSYVYYWQKTYFL